jgi:DNA helicase HerA-like ATPase
MRRALEAALPSTASSLDGRRFTFRCSVEGLRLQPGGYVSIGERLGQVHSLELASDEVREGAETVRIDLVRGDGAVLEGGGEPFHEIALEPAGEVAVSAWLERTRPAGAALEVGALILEPGVRFSLDAGGFDRHTFFCGQSGSGKTYALGTALERLLLETTLRLVVLDPNSDFVRLAEVRDDADAAVSDRYRDAAASLAVRTAGANGHDRLHVRFTDLEGDEQAAVLRLDPIRDRDEYGVLLDQLESGIETGVSDARDLARRLLAASSPHVQALGGRIRNLGVHGWPIWSTGDTGALQDLVAADGPRALVVDLGSLESPGEKAVAAESVLAALWRRRTQREPVLIVIDEAHNVCPREPADPVTALATEYAARIATEGRKFGLYLLISTQRPQRVNELVVSQCDNLVLMRMNAAGDLAYIAEELSFAPAPLLERATSFRIGEGLVAGKFASHPAFIRFGPRIAAEGGEDVPASWAEAAAS